MTENSIVVATQTAEVDLFRLGGVLSQSGYFADARQAAQAIVKVLAGRELGFGPIASMTGIHIIQGRPAIGADLMAKAVKRSGRYNYRVSELTDEACSIDFFEKSGDAWQPIGVSRFTKQDATKAKTKNLDAFPRNMLFARAMSNGVKWYCPDALGLTSYTPEELEGIESAPIQAPAAPGCAARRGRTVHSRRSQRDRHIPARWPHDARPTAPLVAGIRKPLFQRCAPAGRLAQGHHRPSIPSDRR